MKRILSILLLVLFACNGYSQLCTIKLSGHLEDADSKEKLSLANVRIKETGKTVLTDENGNFLFAGICAGEYTLLFTHVGCDAIEKKIVLTKDYHADVLMPHTRNVLGNVTVDAQRAIANTGFKKELSGKALEQTKGLSLAEALSKINGVTMLQTGSAIAKPVIHGLHSNRILTINNGVRQEGQQWGNEHAPEIDPFIADKLIVIKGVDELRYGSDAIGGVILVEPKVLRNKPGYDGEINTAYFTNNNQYVLSALLEAQLKKLPAFRCRLQGTYKRGANATTPNYRLNNTGSEEKNFSVTIGWKKVQWTTELFYSQFATKIGIFSGAHVGNLTDLQNAIAASKPNAVFLGQHTYTIQRPSQEVSHSLIKSKTIIYKGEHKFTALVAGQFNHRKEFDIVRSNTNKNPQIDLSIYTITEDIGWEHRQKNNFTATAGFSMAQQNNTYSGRYFIPNYTAYSFGGYYIEKWSKHKWELQGGIRYDNKSIGTSRLKFSGDTINYDFNFSTVAASANAGYSPTSNWKLNANISVATRAPFVNELLSDGIHHGTATYEKGDIRLKSESSFNTSVGINYWNPSGTFHLDVLLYANSISDFIYQQPFPDSPVLTIAGAFPLIQYKQTNAMLSGFDVTAYAKPIKLMEWITRFSFLNARNTTLNDWLILMPANRLSNELIWNIKDGKKITNTYVSAEMMNVFRQVNVPGEKNGKQDYKAPPGGYTLVHLNASSTFSVGKTPVTFNVGVKNLLNVVYRDYLNSMRYFTDEMGRNISIRLKIQLL